MTSSLGRRFINSLETIDRRQTVGRDTLLRGRMGGAALWVACNLAALGAAFFSPPSDAQYSDSPPLLPAVCCVAAAQAFFAILLLPAVIKHRYALRIAPVIRPIEIFMWLLIGLVFMAAASFADSLDRAASAIALASGAMMFLPGICLARIRPPRGLRSGSLPVGLRDGGGVAASIVTIFGGMAVIVVLLMCGLNIAAGKALNLYPPALAWRLADDGPVLPSLWTGCGLLLWLVVVPVAALKWSRRRR